MFLLAANRMSRGYARIRQWLILAARVLACLGLVFVVGRPLTGGWLGLAAGGRAGHDDPPPRPLAQHGPGRPGGRRVEAETGRRQLVRDPRDDRRRRWVLIDGSTGKPSRARSLDALRPPRRRPTGAPSRPPGDAPGGPRLHRATTSRAGPRSGSAPTSARTTGTPTAAAGRPSAMASSTSPAGPVPPPRLSRGRSRQPGRPRHRGPVPRVRRRRRAARLAQGDPRRQGRRPPIRAGPVRDRRGPIRGRRRDGRRDGRAEGPPDRPRQGARTRLGQGLDPRRRQPGRQRLLVRLRPPHPPADRGRRRGRPRPPARSSSPPRSRPTPCAKCLGEVIGVDGVPAIEWDDVALLALAGPPARGRRGQAGQGVRRPGRPGLVPPPPAARRADVPGRDAGRGGSDGPGDSAVASWRGDQDLLAADPGGRRRCPSGRSGSSGRAAWRASSPPWPPSKAAPRSWPGWRPTRRGLLPARPRRHRPTRRWRARASCFYVLVQRALADGGVGPGGDPPGRRRGEPARRPDPMAPARGRDRGGLDRLRRPPRGRTRPASGSSPSTGPPPRTPPRSWPTTGWPASSAGSTSRGSTTGPASEGR